MNNYTDYDLVNDALIRCECDQDAAEQHGQLCALLCLMDGVSLEAWLDIALAGCDKNNAFIAETRGILAEVFEATLKSIDAEDFNFQLLMPDDETALTTRLQGVSHWCQGFLMGVTQAGITDIDKLASNLPEIVRDFVEISRAESFDVEGTEEDEASFVEISEFVRMGTLLFRVEFKQFVDSQAKGGSEQTH